MTRSLRDEFLRCQEHLAYQEWVTSGAASRFRIVSFRSAKGTPFRGAKGDYRTASAPWLHLPPDLPERATWDECVAHYLAGRLDEAVPPDNPHGDYAAAMIALELGDATRARKRLSDLARSESPAPVRIAAESWLRQMESLKP